MFFAHARARGCGDLGVLWPYACQQEGKGLLTRNRNLSSLSSLSSLKGEFLHLYQLVVGFTPSEIILPKLGAILPMLPKKIAASQYAVSTSGQRTKYRKWGKA